MKRNCGTCLHSRPRSGNPDLLCKEGPPTNIGAQSAFPIVPASWHCSRHAHRKWWRRLLSKFSI